MYLTDILYLRSKEVKGKTLFSTRYVGKQNDSEVRHYLPIIFSNECKEKKGLPTSSFSKLTGVSFRIFCYKKNNGETNLRFVIEDYESVEDVSSVKEDKSEEVS